MLHSFVNCQLSTVLFVLLLLCGCNFDAHKAIRRIEYKAPLALPDYCGTRYPPKVYDSTRISYKPGEVKITTDTVTRHDTATNTIYCDTHHYHNQTDTVEKEVVRQVENTAATEAQKRRADLVQQQLAVLQNQYQQRTKGRNTWMALFFIAVGAIGLYIGVKWFIKQQMAVPDAVSSIINHTS